MSACAGKCLTSFGHCYDGSGDAEACAANREFGAAGGCISEARKQHARSNVGPKAVSVDGVGIKALEFWIGGEQAPAKRGRPLAASTLRVREAVLDLVDKRDRMTVRGIFYALTTTHVVPKTEAGYRKVQTQVLAMRREGLLPWSFVADGTRWVRQASTYDSTEEALNDVARLYRRDLWRSQDVRVELWLEKDALADLIWPTVNQWGVPLLVSRGTSSATFLHNAAQEAEVAFLADGRRTVVLALYDHDAGGERAFRTVVRGMAEYAPLSRPTVKLLGVTAEQIEAWNLPTRPAKAKDPEAKRWGDRPAVELDAISPDQLRQLVDDAILEWVDPHAWNVAQAYETAEREGLMLLAEQVRGDE